MGLMCLKQKCMYSHFFFFYFLVLDSIEECQYLYQVIFMLESWSCNKKLETISQNMEHSPLRWLFPGTGVPNERLLLTSCLVMRTTLIFCISPHFLSLRQWSPVQREVENLQWGKWQEKKINNGSNPSLFYSKNVKKKKVLAIDTLSSAHKTNQNCRNTRSAHFLKHSRIPMWAYSRLNSWSVTEAAIKKLERVLPCPY